MVNNRHILLWRNKIKINNQLRSHASLWHWFPFPRTDFLFHSPVSHFLLWMQPQILSCPPQVRLLFILVLLVWSGPWKHALSFSQVSTIERWCTLSQCRDTGLQRSQALIQLAGTQGALISLPGFHTLDLQQPCVADWTMSQPRGMSAHREAFGPAGRRVCEGGHCTSKRTAWGGDTSIRETFQIYSVKMRVQFPPVDLCTTWRKVTPRWISLPTSRTQKDTIMMRCQSCDTHPSPPRLSLCFPPSFSPWRECMWKWCSWPPFSHCNLQYLTDLWTLAPLCLTRPSFLGQSNIHTCNSILNCGVSCSNRNSFLVGERAAFCWAWG